MARQQGSHLVTRDVAGEYVLLECGSLTCGGLRADHPIGSAVASLWATGTLYEDISVYIAFGRSSDLTPDKT